MFPRGEAQNLENFGPLRSKWAKFSKEVQQLHSCTKGKKKTIFDHTISLSLGLTEAANGDIDFRVSSSLIGNCLICFPSLFRT